MNTRAHTAGIVSAPSVELIHSLVSSATAVLPSLNRLMQFIEVFMGKYGAVKKNQDEIANAAREALTNAVIHGNHENPLKHVYVTCRCSMDGEVVITVRDQGDGFDYTALSDSTDPQHLFLNPTRGLYLMRSLMDEVSFGENGTVVQMRKRIRSANRNSMLG